MKKDIRFLVTNSCNYGCYFCHAEGVSGTLGKNELTVENYLLSSISILSLKDGMVLLCLEENRSYFGTSTSCSNAFMRQEHR